jgi:hypothetical protein
MKKHFVSFFSPGTFTHEATQREIESWDVDEAMRIAASIVERHGAKPYGFQFLTRERGEGDLDSHVSARSGMHFIGGRVITLDEIKSKNNPDDNILIQNMECNKWDRVVQTCSPSFWMQPFEDGDSVVDVPDSMQLQ